jgi:hypothetical protein
MALLLVVLATGVEPAFARDLLDCSAKQVVIVYAPSGSTSSSTEENLRFLIDESSKTILLADGTPLTVRRFDNIWISADYADMRYEFDRQNGSVTYAGAAVRNGVSTVTVGSGRCKIANAPAGRPTSRRATHSPSQHARAVR